MDSKCKVNKLAASKVVVWQVRNAHAAVVLLISQLLLAEIELVATKISCKSTDGQYIKRSIVTLKYLALNSQSRLQCLPKILADTLADALSTSTGIETV